MSERIERNKDQIGKHIAQKLLTVKIQLTDEEFLELVNSHRRVRLIPGTWRNGRYFRLWDRGPALSYTAGGYWTLSASTPREFEAACKRVLALWSTSSLPDAQRQIPLQMPSQPVSKEIAKEYIAKCREILARPKS